MGSPLSEPGRALVNEDSVTVTLTRAFAIQRYENTQAEWEALCLQNPSKVDLFQDVDQGDCLQAECPVGHVSWYQAVAFANAVSKAAGLPECYALTCGGMLSDGSLRCSDVVVTASSPYECVGYRLPTEAEWEYAYRAGTTSAFYSGEFEPDASWFSASICDTARDVLEPIAWYCVNADRYSHPVGMKQPNPSGLYDMAGNLMEWVSDTYDPNGYGKTPKTDPWSLGGVRGPVTRGGYYWSSPDMLRAASRLGLSDRNDPGFGFRLVRTIHEPLDGPSD